MFAVLFVPIGGGEVTWDDTISRADPIDLSGFSSKSISGPVHLLFIHHSCGGQLMATASQEEKGEHCIYESHPNGGGLRALLEDNGYEVHEASYGSRLGEHTDLFDWPGKFKEDMNAILRCRHQDDPYEADVKNTIVAFKSCFPNNEFTGLGIQPGSPNGPGLTVENAKAALSALLPEFERHPEVLFVYVTAPPLAPRARSRPVWKQMAATVLDRPSPSDRLRLKADLARRFDNWVVSADGWLKGRDLKNVVVFDYYDVLTGHGRSNLSEYPTGDGGDSHPSTEGNTLAAREFVPLLNRAVRRAGIRTSQQSTVNSLQKGHGE